MILVALAVYYATVSVIYAVLSVLDRAVAEALVVLFVALLLAPEVWLVLRRRRRG